MDYVYICRDGENEELRYSLRSIEKNMPKGRVWLIGNRPKWYIGDLIYVKDIGGKFENIRNCIRVASEHLEISDNFVLMNDDFFALNKISIVPTLHGGLLIDKIERYKELGMASKYIKLLELTYKQLVSVGIKDPIDYDIHVPMIMNKNKLKESLDMAYFPRSTYGNFANIGGEKITDVKIYGSEKSKVSKGANFISTEDKSFISLRKNLLVNSFPTPGSLENPHYDVLDVH
jgi:hypothetical protein